MRSIVRISFAAALALALWCSAPLRADEGFWPFNAAPRDAIRQTYGVELTDAWLEHVRLASVRFGGACGSFVSPDGLVLTNHHVGLGAIQKLSTRERDLVQTGFHARSRAEELPAKDTELNVLVSMEDVTGRVNAAARPGLAQGEAYAARRAAMTAIEKESTEKTGLKSEVVTLYQGAQYHLYRYKRYTDVRLVFAPEFDIAFFGGDPDNFTYPRYNLDITLFRVYENGEPAKTDHYLKWSTAGAREGEVVFTSGHPGPTQRLNTVAHLEYVRDVALPGTLKFNTRRLGVLRRYAERGPEQFRQVKDEIFGLENAIKSQTGQLQGLRDAAVMARKEADEAALREAVRKDAALSATFGDPWKEIAAARRAVRGYAAPYEALEMGRGFTSRLFSFARWIVRAAAERQKPDTERLPEYTESRRPTYERMLLSPAPVYPAAEEAKLADSLAWLVDTLGADHEAVKAALQGQSPAERARALISGTTLASVDVRKGLLEGGAEAVKASSDPLIALALAVDGEARALRARYENEVVSVERDGYARIARALFAVKGTAAYPDATSTLRLSYGAVKGYEEDGRRVAPFTDFAGLYQRVDEKGGKAPWELPARWVERKASLDLTVPYNFVTTNDIVGGNSGSPVINARGELVGIAFDGNIQSLPGYFIYDGSVNRTVAVDARGIIEALESIYGAEALVNELLGRKPAAAPTASAVP